MINIEEYRKQTTLRKENLIKKTEKKSFVDERFWDLTYDKNTKSGRAIIRPIGPASGDDEEFVLEHKHFIHKGNKWLVETCPSTVAGRKCPICEKFFDENREDKSLSRSTKAIMNILVIDDPAKPENNGKVFLYRAPMTILNKIKDKLNPEFDSDPSINVFDMWEGANIRVVSRDKGGFINFENSYIEDSSPIFEDTENLVIYEELLSKLYSLKEFKENAPTYEEMKEKFDAFNNKNNNLAELDKINSEDRKMQKEILDDDKVETSNTHVEVEEVSEDDFFADLNI